MPLVLRVALYVFGDLPPASTDGPAAQERVAVWVSYSLTPSAKAKDVIHYFLKVVRDRMKATLYTPSGGWRRNPDDSDADGESSKWRRLSFFSPRKSKGSFRSDSGGSNSSAANAQAVRGEWALCLQDVHGQFHFCGDSARYGKSRLVNAPFLTEVALESHRQFEASLEELRRVGDDGLPAVLPVDRGAEDASLSRSGSQSGELARPSEPRRGTGTTSVTAAWLASTSAALQFAEEHNSKCAFVSGALVPMALLNLWNPNSTRFGLYDTVELPSDLKKHPVAPFPLPVSVHTRDRAASSGASAGGGYSSSRAPASTKSSTGDEHHSRAPSTASATDVPSTAESVRSRVASPTLPLKDSETRRGQSPLRDTERSITAVDAERQTASSPPDEGPSRVCQLATHATSFRQVGSMDPVLAVPATEWLSVWRQPEIALDGVDEAQRQRMIAEEDVARLRLAKSHLLYDDVVRRCQAARVFADAADRLSVSVPSASQDRAAPSPREREPDPQLADLLRRKSLLTETINANSAAERECEKLTLLVEFYEKELSAAHERVDHLQGILEASP